MRSFLFVVCIWQIVQLLQPRLTICPIFDALLAKHDDSLLAWLGAGLVHHPHLLARYICHGCLLWLGCRGARDPEALQLELELSGGRSCFLSELLLVLVKALELDLQLLGLLSIHLQKFLDFLDVWD